ncbi:MAG: hypothetical protein ACRDOB_13135 [Streptosporangiaceae bacterium]
MPDRRDDLDSWLDGRISPLPPPPGTFELIKRRARRRKYRRLGVTAGVAAVIVAAAVTVPQMVILPALNTTKAAGAANTSSSSPTSGPTPTGSVSAAASGATPIVPNAAAPVPANFQPTSVTFISLHTGWVIGQACTPGHCATQYCTSVARTGDAGQTWQGGPAPLAGPAAGATGVSQIRFLNLDNGWAFGPQLFATHDGGQTWTQVSTNGMRVVDLETVGDRAFALFASCSGAGPAFGAACTSFSLYSSPASANDWAPVGAATSGLSAGTGQAGASQHGAASIVLTGAFGYLLGPNRMLYTGPVEGSAPWQAVASVPCATGSALADGQPAGALLAAATATSLILACTPPAISSGLQKKLIFSSANGGVSWQQIAIAPVAGVADSVAASLAGTVVLGTDQGIDVLPAGAGSWQQATVTGAPAGGFSYVGMTSASQGVAVPADPSAGAVWFTFDAGRDWQPSSVRSS